MVGFGVVLSGSTVTSGNSCVQLPE